MPHIDLPGSFVYLSIEASQVVETCRDQTDILIRCENATLPTTPVFCVHLLLKFLQYSKM